MYKYCISSYIHDVKMFAFFQISYHANFPVHETMKHYKQYALEN